MTVNPTVSVSHNLTSGPNKMDLMLAVFDPQPEGYRNVRTVWLGVGGLKIEAIVHGAAREEGSGLRWIIQGSIRSCTYGKNLPFEAYFDTTTRTGHITITLT